MTTQRPTRARWAAALVAAGIGATLSLVPSAAIAAQPTSIAFTGETSVVAPFASDWSLTLVVSTDFFGDGTQTRLGTTDGTVDIYASGVGGTFATALPIQPDGLVYVSQPLAKDLLPTGSYELTAIFNPAAGGPYATSQTVAPARLEITALGLQPRVEVVNDAAVSKYPVITASLAGEFVETNGGAPAGTWSFTVTDASNREVYATDIVQQNEGKEPVRAEIATKLSSGSEFTLVTTFTPIDQLAGGITVADAPVATFETPGTTFVDALSSRIPFPWYLVLAIGILLVGLVTTLVILAVKLSRRGPAPSATAVSATRVPGDPQEVEILSWEDAGLTPQPGEVLSASTTWALSDGDVAVDEADTALHAENSTDGELDSAEPATEALENTPKGKKPRAPKTDS